MRNNQAVKQFLSSQMAIFSAFFEALKKFNVKRFEAIVRYTDIQRTTQPDHICSHLMPYRGLISRYIFNILELQLSMAVESSGNKCSKTIPKCTKIFHLTNRIPCSNLIGKQLQNDSQVLLDYLYL